MLKRWLNLGAGSVAGLLAACTCGKTGATVKHPEAPLRGAFVPLDSSAAKWSLSFPSDSTALLEIRTGDSLYQAVYSVTTSGTHEVRVSPK